MVKDHAPNGRCEERRSRPNLQRFGELLQAGCGWVVMLGTVETTTEGWGNGRCHRIWLVVWVSRILLGI